jgi:hypothetical protein
MRHLAPTLFCAALLLVGPAPPVPAQQPETRTTFRTAVRNLHAPELYSRSVRVRVTLVELPGAGDPATSWEMSYQLYHISEATLEKAVRGRPRGGWSPTAEDFPGRVLLGEGKFRRAGLSTPGERTVLSAPMPFRSKVADRDRTKFAHLLLVYSLKINDARLGSTLYRSGAFLNDPFETLGDGRDVARTTFPLSFLVTPQGRVYSSVRPQDATTANWQ